MFKYLRTANSDNHPTEVVEFFAYSNGGADCVMPAGAIFSTEEGMVQLSCNTTQPLYLSLTSKGKDEEAYIKCIPVLKNMIFEASLAPEEDENIVFNGSLCYLHFDETGKGIGLTITLEIEDALFEVIDTSNIKNRKITVRKI